MSHISKRRNILIFLCLTLAIAAVYWPVRRFEFTNYDDGSSVIDNPHVQGRLKSHYCAIDVPVMSLSGEFVRYGTAKSVTPSPLL